MKKIISIITLLISIQAVAETKLDESELAWVNEQVEAIIPARKGSSVSSLNALSTPFVLLKNDGKATKVSSKKIYKKYKTVGINKPFNLEAIMNTSALINGKWYKEGESLKGYTLEKVSAQDVVLKRGKKIITLTTKSQHRILKFNNN